MQTTKNALKVTRRLPSSAVCTSSRNISLTGAIERGLRKGQRSLEDKHEPRQRPERRTAWRPKYDEDDRPDSIRWPQNTQGDDVCSARAPRTLPYTTASSEFVYGTFAVNAAIRARRRKLYKLYIHGQEDDGDSIGSTSIKRRAEAAGIEVQKTSGTAWKLLFDRASENRPHNGYILEASTIPVLPVTALNKVEAYTDAVSVQVGQLTAEDAAITEAFGVFRSTAKIPVSNRQKRCPMFLLLDRVTDLGNLGAIIRSAYYFGVNAIVLLDHGTAPLTGVTVKASAGAAELLPILRIRDENGFILASKANGWHFAAAVAPDDVSLMNNKFVVPEHDMDKHSLEQRPMVVMLGNEAEGLRMRLARLSNSHLTIQDAVSQHSGVDSLNVSVAAGILMHDLLRPFLGEKRSPR